MNKNKAITIIDDDIKADKSKIIQALRYKLSLYMDKTDQLKEQIELINKEHKKELDNLNNQHIEREYYLNKELRRYKRYTNGFYGYFFGHQEDNNLSSPDLD
jgi:hypothetical protein